MPFYYQPGGSGTKHNLRNTAGYMNHYNWNGGTKEGSNLDRYQNYFKGQPFKMSGWGNNYLNLSNNTLDRPLGTTKYKINGTDVGNSLSGRLIIFHPNRDHNTITHNWTGPGWNVSRYNYYTDNHMTFGNARTVNINIGNQWNRAAFITQGGGGGGAHSNTYNGNGNAGAGGGGGGTSATGVQAINSFGGRNFNLHAGAGGRGGEHHKYVQDVARDWPSQAGGHSSMWCGNHYIQGNGGSGKDGWHWTHQNGVSGGNGQGNAVWGGNHHGESSEAGQGGAQRSGRGGYAGTHYVKNNGHWASHMTNRMNHNPGWSTNNNQPGLGAGGNYNWNYHGGPVEWNAPNQYYSGGGGGGGAAGNNAGNGRPGKGGGHGGDGYVMMFLYM